MNGAEELAGVAEALPDALLEYVEDDGQGDVVADKPDDQSSAEVEVDPLVAKAQKDGWTDKDAWVEAGKDPDQWVDAKEFISRKPLYDRNRELKRELKAERERTEKVAKYAARAAETARKQVFAELESEKYRAVEIGDVDGVKEVEQRIKEAEKEYPLQPAEEPDANAEEIPAFVKEFADRNSKWFEKNEDMTDLMFKKVEKHSASGKPLDEAIRLAEADVKRAFAHLFLNPNKDKPSAVGSSNKEERPNTVTHAQLSAEQRQIWSAIKKTGMTFDEFVTDLKAQGEFK
jgi:hypothetical protein